MKRRILTAIVLSCLAASGVARANTVTISAVADLQGKAFFKSDARVFNRSYTDSISVTANYYCSSAPCGNSPQTFSIPPRQSVAYDDIAVSLFAKPNSQGAVVFQADKDELTATSRLYSVASSGDLAGGSFGQFVPGLEDEDAYATSVLTSLRNSHDSHTGFRTHLTGFNPSSSVPAHVKFLLFDGSGAALGQFSLTVGPLSFLPAIAIFDLAGAGSTDTDNAYCVVAADTNFFVAASVLDNISQDTIFVKGESDDALPSTNPPAADFTFSPPAPTAGSPVTFTDASTGSPTSWSWTFGDQSAADTTQDPAHAFAQAGTYFVTLVSSGPNGSAEKTHAVTVKAGVAPLTVTLNDTYYSPAPMSVNPGDTVTWVNQGDYTDHTVTDDGGGFDSGFIFAHKGVTFTHLFTASDAGKTFHYECQSHGQCCGMKGTITVNVTGVPVAAFSFAPPHPVAGSSVSLTDASSGNPTSWAWTFGDPGSGSSNAATAQNPTHTFATAGTYTVSLTAHNSFGDSVAVTHDVTVDPPAGTAPTPDFAFLPSSPFTGQSVKFTDKSTGGPTSWTWDFGDSASGSANTSTLENPSHTFSVAATYTVKLTAGNGSGSNQKTTSVVIQDPPPPYY